MKVLKNSLIYIIALLVQGLLSFLLLPFYTRYLTTREYGIVGVINAMVSLFSVFYLFGLHGAITRLYFEYQSDKKKLKEFFGTILSFVVLSSFTFTILLALFKNILLEPFLREIDFYPYIFLGLIFALLNPLYVIFQAILQVRQQGEKYGIITILFFSTNTFFIVFLVAVVRLHTVGILIAPIITNLIFLFYLLVKFIPTITIGVNRKILFEVLTYSFPLFLNSLSSWSIFLVNKILLNNLAATSFVGIYEVGFYIGNIVNVFVMAIGQAYTPWFFTAMKKGRKDIHKVVMFADYAMLFYGASAMFISLFGKELLQIIVTERFQTAWKILPFISFSYVFYGIYSFFISTLVYDRKYTKYIPFSTLFGAVLNTLINIFLIPRYGILGSAIGTLISIILTSVFVVIVSSKIDYIGLHWRRMYLTSFIFLLISLFIFMTDMFTPMAFLLIKIAIILVATVVIIYYDRKIIWFSQIIMSRLKIRR